MRATNFIIGFILLTLTTLVTNSFATIGEVSITSGSAVIDRQDGDKGITVKKELDIFSYDTVKTGNGKVGIEFIDETRVDVTEHSKLVIDEFVYDPNTKTGSLSLKASLGTVRYASGQIAKNSKQNVKISTPTATIAVRGTDFAMTVNEIGGSTIVLLPSCNSNGQCYVGEIEVQTDAGFVIMNQAFQVTQVDTLESKPLKPILLDLDLDMINNLLIISPPEKLDEAMEEQKLKEVANALDLDFLKFDDLEIDMLEVEEDEYASALDIDFLDQNFLVDILEQLNKQLALQMRSEFDKKNDKKKAGKDEFGIILLLEDPQWVWTRLDAAQNNIVLRLDMENSYNLNVTQGDQEIIDYELGDGGQNQIRIYQNQ
tara:strand:+ start:2022 stop:3137 length:1116 start_codon:yes stop_codon:yes gene_type:complete